MKKVLISGGWDLMHYNHVKTLQMAKAYGDYLVVHVVSDERMRAKKGKDRPFIPLQERMFVVSALKCVDEVISIPGEDYPIYKALEKVKPDVLLINTDEQKNIREEEIYCNINRIRIVGIPRIDNGISTTKLIKRLRGKNA